MLGLQLLIVTIAHDERRGDSIPKSYLLLLIQYATTTQIAKSRWPTDESEAERLTFRIRYREGVTLQLITAFSVH